MSMNEADLIIGGKTVHIGNYPQAHQNPENEGGVVVIDKYPSFKIENGGTRRLTDGERRELCGPPRQEERWDKAEWPDSGIIRYGFEDIPTHDVFKMLDSRRFGGRKADFYQDGKLMGTIVGGDLEWTPEATAERERAAVARRIAEIGKFCEELRGNSFATSRGWADLLPNGQKAWNPVNSASLIALNFGGETAGYEHARFPERKTGDENRAAFALVGLHDGDKDGRFVVNFHSKFYGDTIEFVMDRQNPEDKKQIEELYGADSLWLRSPVPEATMSVYQVRNTRDAGFVPLTSFDPAKFVKVAEVKGSDLELCFAITNNDSPLTMETGWRKLQDSRLRVLPVSKEENISGFYARSTSVGDVVVVHPEGKEAEGVSYECVGVGWKMIPGMEVAQAKESLAANEAQDAAKYLPTVEPTEEGEQARL